MKLNIDTKNNKIVSLDAQAKTAKEVEVVLQTLFEMAPKEKGDSKKAQDIDAFGNTIITLDNMAEMLAILNEAGDKTNEAAKLIRRITNMSVKDSREWVSVHFRRWSAKLGTERRGK